MRFSEVIRHTVRAVKQYFRRRWNVQALFVYDEISPFIRRHLTNVYFSAMCVLASFTFGSYIIGNIGSLVAFPGALLSTIGFRSVVPWKQKKRFFILVCAAFCGGATLAPWFSRQFNIDQGSLVISLVGLSLGCGCYWASSLWTNDFYRVYNKAFLLCIPISLAWIFLASFLFGDHSTCWNRDLWEIITSVQYWNQFLAILCFVAYVRIYSLELVLKSRRGDDDYLKHAVTLFTDLPAVVFHVLISMLKKAIDDLPRLLERDPDPMD